LSGEARYFRDWPALLDFLAAVPADSAPDRPVLPSAEAHMSNKHARRHCLLVSQEADEGRPGSATIWYLDSLDDQGVPCSDDLDDHYQAFKKLGAEGWRLVQVIERPAAEGVYDGPVGPSTHYYFSRPARGRG
jgi:hypothetical protein